MWAVTAGQTRGMEQETYEKCGIAPLALMENAGRAVAEVAWQLLWGRQVDARPWLVRVRPSPGLEPDGSPGMRLAHALGGRPPRVAVMAGRGNNGGDGLAAARHLHAWGVDVTVFLYTEPERLTPDAGANYRACDQSGIVRLALVQGHDPVRESLAQADLIIDALLGTGIRGAPREPVAGAIRAIAESGRPVLSVDIPSGADSDTGAVPGDAVRASWTVTFGSPKLGLFLYPAASLTGEVWVAAIGIPKEVAPPGPVVYPLALPARVGSWLPEPGEDAHKGSRGRVLVVGGSRAMPGAVALAAQAALRAGAGLVVAAVPEPAGDLVAAQAAEVITRRLPAGSEGGFAADAIRALYPYLDRSVALAVGPGIGEAEPALALVRELVRRAGKPIVLDADGLKAFAGKPESLREAAGPVVLTPHAGELSLLLGIPLQAIQSDRPAAAQEAAERTGQVVVLKGPHTLVAAGGGARFPSRPLGGSPGPGMGGAPAPSELSREVWVNLTGNRALATAGSGDVLTGIILALIAQGMSAPEAAVAGVTLHGLAADRIAGRIARDGILAGDLLRELPAARASLARAGRGARP